MKKQFLFPLIALAFASCMSSGDQQATEPVVPAPASETTPPVSQTVVSADTNATTGAQQTTAPVVATPAPAANPTVTAVPPAAAKSTGSSAPNPAHGQPGHRCDIAVGAPLNSPAGTGMQQPAAGAKPAVQAQAAPAASTGSAKLNPAHGQPGHRCDIAVGVPLNSPAGTGLQQPQQQPQPQPQQQPAGGGQTPNN